MLPQRWQYIPIIVRAWRYAVALLGAVGLAALYQASGRNVEVVVDGGPLTLHTHARTSGAVLRELGILPREQDTLSPSASIALVGSAATVELRTARPVLIQAPSGTVWQASPDLQVENILDAAGVLLYPGDTVLVNGLRTRQLAARPGDAPRLIQLRNGHPIELRIDGVPNTIYSAAPTLGEALWENGIRLYEGDSIRPGPESGLSGPLQAEITRSRPLQIALAGSDLPTRSAAATVGQALAESGIALLGLDYSLPDSTQPLPPDGQVRVVRVLEVIQVEQEPLPFTTTYQPVDTLEIDQRSVVQAGAYGVSARRIRSRLEDGSEVARAVEGEWIAQQPQDQITGYGTQIQVRGVATDDGGIEYW
ncbi:MAG TPA: ubiquitin-like domain-containing protein, partial [Anaerolineales bacterium]|nr:ubiquitin-like domain-containing protein [Anaerolineales bacterium]